MERLKATDRDFCNSLRWTEGVHGKSDLIKFIGGLLLIALGPTSVVATLTGWSQHFEPFMPWLVVASLLYVTWNLAIAWHRNAGPIIWISDPEANSHDRLFELRIENRGPGTVIARVFAQNMLDKSKRRIPRIDDQVELHWRGKHKGEDMELFANKPGIAVIMAFNKESPDSPQFMLPGDKPKTLVMPVFTNPIQELKFQQVTFEIRVDFYDSGGARLKSASRRYSLIPSTGHPFGYALIGA